MTDPSFSGVYTPEKLRHRSIKGCIWGHSMEHWMWDDDDEEEEKEEDV